MHELARGIRLLQPDDYRRMRWKNGLGMTTEISISPRNAGLEGIPFDWRVSLAEVENDCEFSRFPGYDRSILLVDGAGMELSFESAPSQRIDQPHKPFRFKGEWQIDCRLLNGPVRDFNVMSARSKFTHACEVLTSPSSVPWQPHSETLLIHCLHGGFNLKGLQDEWLEINTGHTLILDKRTDFPVDKVLKLSAVPNNVATVLVRISNR